MHPDAPHFWAPRGVPFGDLISYRNCGKRLQAIADEVEQTVFVYAGQCIDVHAEEILFSACAVASRHAKKVGVVALGCRPSVCPRDQARCCVGASVRRRVLRDCGSRGDVMGADVGEVAEVDGRDRKDRQPLAHRDHRSVGAAQAPVGVASASRRPPIWSDMPPPGQLRLSTAGNCDRLSRQAPRSWMRSSGQPIYTRPVFPPTTDQRSEPNAYVSLQRDDVRAGAARSCSSGCRCLQAAADRGLNRFLRLTMCLRSAIGLSQWDGRSRKSSRPAAPETGDSSQIHHDAVSAAGVEVDAKPDHRNPEHGDAQCDGRGGTLCADPAIRVDGLPPAFWQVPSAVRSA